METYLKKGIESTDLKSLAIAFLNGTYLEVADKKYRICEIEVYLKSDDHNDEYTHCCEDQAKRGLFYFHKTSKGNLRNGTFKCMDVTLGHDGKYFGILVRALMNIETSEYFIGPCVLLNEILNVAGYEKNDIVKFVEDMGNVEIIGNKIMTLRDFEKPLSDEIFIGPRIGLSDKYPEWKNIDYRFLIHKNSVKKGKRSLKPMI